MDMNQYQYKARRTAVYPERDRFGGIVYCTLGLNGEAGEIAKKIKKILRDSKGVMPSDAWQDLILELGDVLWYVANLAAELNVDLGAVADKNIQKLEMRRQKNTLHGSGDDR